jgi:hypothetical protein
LITFNVSYSRKSYTSKALKMYSESKSPVYIVIELDISSDIVKLINLSLEAYKIKNAVNEYNRASR